jgi:hypothetical protein
MCSLHCHQKPNARASLFCEAHFSVIGQPEMGCTVETRCETAGCFNSAHDSKYCDQCLGGITPDKRGPVTRRELMQARAAGGEDAVVTRARLVANNQPIDDL